MRELFRGEASLRTGVDRFWPPGARDEPGPVETLDLEVSPGPGRRVLYVARWPRFGCNPGLQSTGC
jgi:hypothetical protein